ncbi:MAG: sigma-70 family RNA polymerase sigma factor [Deltaproteobacteria bacterium]|nr:sigma-70 family RNA polymerase sigma factor [Deltaproteobacteria bacterium]MBI3390335.1 sigma-70 family RNA polymerase sigma factor [Deltaproteobacteria bacterium]
MITTYREGLAAAAQSQKLNGQSNGDNSIEDLKQRARRGREACERLVVAHQPLVMSAAHKAYGPNRGYIEFEDLVSAGNEGILLALDRFDLKRRSRFNTYARWWIRNRILGETRRSRWGMRIPDAIYRRVVTPSRLTNTPVRQQLLGGEPPSEQMSMKLGKPLDEHLAHDLLAWTLAETVSLETPVGQTGKTRLGEFLRIDDGDPSMLVEESERSEEVRRLLGTLTPRQEQILRMRFGIGEQADYTLEEVASRFGVTRERIRELQNQAAEKIRFRGVLRKSIGAV